MTDSYHYQIEPEPRAGLNCGEFVITADGGLHRRTHWDHVVTLSAADVRGSGWSDVELLARHLERLDYKRRDSIVFPSGAAVLTSGDKIVGRVEAELSEWDNVKPGAIINIRKPAQYITRTDTATYAAPSGNRLMTAADIRAAIDAALAATFSAPASTPIAPAIAPEPIRPALDWNTATPFDTFGPDFIVTKGAEPTRPLYDSPTTDSAYPAIAGLLRG